MFARTVSLALIAAIVACPMGCGNGLRFVRQCCSAAQDSPQACPVHKTACCCRESLPDGDERCPCESPRKSSCQGICGGAIFERPCEIDDHWNSVVLRLVDAEISTASRPADCCSFGVDHRHDSQRENYGRSVRIRHLSFLC
jgi:hypothetical protein